MRKDEDTLLYSDTNGVTSDCNIHNILLLLDVWQDFFQPLIFMNTPEKYTVSLALKLFLDPASFSNYGGMFAMCFISLLPVIVFFISFQGHLVEGMATSGVKG